MERLSHIEMKKFTGVELNKVLVSYVNLHKRHYLRSLVRIFLNKNKFLPYTDLLIRCLKDTRFESKRPPVAHDEFFMNFWIPIDYQDRMEYQSGLDDIFDFLRDALIVELAERTETEIWKEEEL